MKLPILTEITADIFPSDKPATPNLVDYFNQAIDYVLNFEGGKCNTPGDPGGRTYWGICEQSEGKATMDMMWGLSMDDAKVFAKKIYWHNYWLPIGGVNFTDMIYATCVLDCAVNNGVYLALSLKKLYTTPDTFCDARIAKIKLVYPNGFWLGTDPNKYNIVDSLIDRVNKCRTRAENT